jgi:hypothetical protein
MQVITANRLGDGRVVYLTAGGGWSVALGEALRLGADGEGEAALKRGQAAAARHEVVDPYAVSVVDSPDGPAPASLRERIRAFGPTSAAGKA